MRDFTDEEALAVALIENIQRDELTPIEEAEAYQRLAGEFHRTQEQVAEVVGKSRSHVANMMRLLDLPEDVRQMLAEGQLSAGHARAILRAPDPAALARQIVAEGLTVRDAETLGRVSQGRRRKAGGGKRQRPAKDADTIALERELGNILGLNGPGSGRSHGGAPGPDYDPDDDLDPDDPFGDDGPPADGSVSGSGLS